MTIRDDNTESDRSLTLSKKIDAICDRFETDWKAGKRPSIERLLEGWQDPDRTALHRELAAVASELRLDPLPQAGDTEPLPADVSGTLIEASRNPGSTSQTTAEPERLGRFEILGLLGSGAFGKVYRARDSRLDREVALKVPYSDLLRTADNISRFRREAKAVAALKHDNLCVVYDADEIDGRHFIAMEYIAGQPLSALIERGTPWLEGKAAELVATLADAAEAAHAHGVIHRDLKPSNVIICEKTNKPVITDFGLVRLSGDDDDVLTLAGQIVGTPAYMSPEQAAGDIDSIGPASDVYSLGTMLYELLTGERPFFGHTTKVISDVQNAPLQPPSEHGHNIDPRLEAICLKAMARQITDRYQTMAEFAEAIRHWQAEIAQGTALPVAQPHSTTRGISRRWTWGIGAAVLATAAVLSAVYWPGQGGGRESNAGEEQPVVEWNKDVRDCLTSILPKGLDNGVGRMFYTEITIALDEQKNHTWGIGSKVTHDGKPYLLITQRGRFSHRYATADEIKRMKLGDHQFVRYGSPQVSKVRSMRTPPARLGSPRLRVEKQNGRYHLLGTVQCACNDAVSVQDLTLVVRAKPLSGDPRRSVELYQRIEGTQIKSQLLNVDIDLSRRQELEIDPHRDVELSFQAFLLQPKPSYYTVSNILPCQVKFDRDRKLSEWVIGQGGWVTTSKNWKSNPKVRAIEQLPSKPFQVLAIGLENNKKIGNAHLQQLTGLVGVQTLFLKGSSVDDEGLRNLKTAFPQLQWIDFSGTRVTDKGMKYLGKVKSLQRIDLGGTAVGDDGIKLLAELPNLKWLHLPRTKVTNKGVAHLQDNVALRRLSLSDTLITTDGLKYLKRLRSLEQLNLDGCRIDDSGLKQLEHLSMLEWLQLDNTGISDVGLASLKGMSRLQSLGVKFTDVSDKGLKHLSTLSQLRELYLEDTNITDAGLSTLAMMSQLESLDLMFTSITNVGINALRNLTQLKVLNLNSTDLTDEGLKSLQGMQKLATLALNHTRVTDDGLSHLWGSKNLTRVGVRGTRVTPAAVKLFRQHVAGCIVEWKVDPELLRESNAATWAVRIKGTVQISQDGVIKTVSRVRDLPGQNYQIVKIDLAGIWRVDDRDLVRLKDLSAIRILLLNATDVTDSGLETVGKLSTLQELNLAETSVTDKAVEHLKRLVMLKNLNVRGTKISAEGLRTLRKALPGRPVLDR